MADKKISELTEKTTIVADDLFAAVDSEAGPIETKKVKFSTLSVLPKSILTEQGDIIYASGAATPAALAHGNARQFLTSGGHGANPSWRNGYEFGPQLTTFESQTDFTHWTSSVTGSGSITKQDLRLDMVTGATNPSTVIANGCTFGWINWGSAGKTWEWYIKIYFFTGLATSKIWLKIGGADAADLSDKGWGWRIDNNAVHGIVWKTSLTDVNLSTVLSVNAEHELYIKLVQGDKIYWYVDGVVVGSSSEIPITYKSGSSYPVVATSNGAASSIEFVVLHHAWIFPVTN